jgi:hypothetical protein
MAKKTELRRAIQLAESSDQSEAHLVQGHIEDLLADDAPNELIQGSLREIQGWAGRFLTAISADIQNSKPCAHTDGTRGGVCETCGKEL